MSSSSIPEATPVLAARQELSESLEDMLFALMMLGDDRAVRAVYIRGREGRRPGPERRRSSCPMSGFQ